MNFTESAVELNLSTGYIKLYRSLLKHPLWTNCPDAWLRIALACLLSANWKPGRWWDGKQELEIPSGSFITSPRKMADLSGTTRQKVRSAFSFFQKSKFATIETTNSWTRVTITNWTTYQADKGDDNQPHNQRVTHQQPTSNHKQEGKKGRREEEGDSPLPPSFDFDFETWSRERLQRHPNKRDSHLGVQQLSQQGWIDDPAERAVFNRTHDTWSECEMWNWKNGSNCPRFAEFVIDYNLSYRGQRPPEEKEF